MPWTKLKNMILLILVVANISLLGLVVSQNLQSSRQSSKTWENTLLFLSERGVQVDEEKIPQSIDLLPQTAERDLEEEQQAAAGLLRGDVETEARGGEIYRYSNGQGWVQFHSDGTFSAQLEPGVYSAGEEQTAGCLAALAAMGFVGTQLKETEDGSIVQQTWDTTPLFGQQANVVCVDGSVSTITGRRLVGQPKPDPARETITAPTALIRFLNGISALGDVCNRIDTIETGYLCAASLSGSMTLTPVWQITTDIGTYQLDTVTGSVWRVE